MIWLEDHHPACCWMTPDDVYGFEQARVVVRTGDFPMLRRRHAEYVRDLFVGVTLERIYAEADKFARYNKTGRSPGRMQTALRLILPSALDKYEASMEKKLYAVDDVLICAAMSAVPRTVPKKRRAEPIEQSNPHPSLEHIVDALLDDTNEFAIPKALSL